MTHQPDTFYLYVPVLKSACQALVPLSLLMIALGLLRTRKLLFWRCLSLVVSGWSWICLSRVDSWEVLVILDAIAASVFAAIWYSIPARILFLATVLLFLIIVPSFIRTNCGGQLTSCKSNLKNMATALEMYQEDHGHYPLELAALTPEYLKVIPNCPSAQENTYALSYLSKREPDAFTMFCWGGDHERSNTPYAYPRYSSYQGLIER